MTLIEGVGDEVVQFMAGVMVVMVAALAWWSTNARPGRYSTVLVMRSRAHHPVTVSIRTRSNSSISHAQVNSTIQDSTANVTDTNPSSTMIETPGDSARVIPIQEMDSIVDADMAMMDNNRLHFYRRIDMQGNPSSTTESTSDESETQDDPEPASNAQIREMDSIVSAMEADVTTNCDFFTRSNEPNSTSGNNAKAIKKDNKNDTVASTTSNPTAEGNCSNAEGATGDTDRKKILIKLKYLNDTLKEVEGSLDELLKDFKWRHFSTELSAECRVRLIFNGRVLLDDAATLRACGLHDRAVVHCLVHPKRTANQQRGIPEDATMNATHELITEGVQPERAWDFENILMTIVCEYSNMFTASASVVLLGLTIFYGVAIFGLYLSDTFHSDRRPAQQVSNN